MQQREGRAYAGAFVPAKGTVFTVGMMLDWIVVGFAITLGAACALSLIYFITWLIVTVGEWWLAR